MQLLQVREGMNCGHEKVSDNVTLCPIAFASNSQYSTITLNEKHLAFYMDLKNFTYHFAKEVYVITDHKPLVVMVNKDVTKLPVVAVYRDVHSSI